jgi:lantibiotic biosynthesis protein
VVVSFYFPVDGDVMKESLRLLDQGLFLARTPLLPMALFQAFADSGDKVAFVHGMFQQPLLRNALYLASPSLFDRYQAWAQDDLAGQEKLCLALCKYLARSAYRCTPFGLFAAITPGRVAKVTSLTHLDQAPILPRLRFDFALQAKIVNILLADHTLRPRLCYQANNSLSVFGNKIYFVEGVDGSTQKHYHLTQVEREPYLDSLLALARQALTFDQLVQHLTSCTGVSVEQAQVYLHELIDSEILLPDSGIRITTPASGPDSFGMLVQKLESMGEGERIAPLARLVAALPQDPATPDWAAQLDHVWHALAQWPNLAAQRKQLFQVDAKREASVTLSQQQVARITRACQCLAQLTMQPNAYMDDFKRRFAERFEEREVALDVLFNDELGLPFPREGKLISDLLNGIDFPGRRGKASQAPGPEGLERLLFQKFEQALAQGAGHILISEQEAQQAYQPQPAQATSANSGARLKGGVYVLASLFEAALAGQSGEEVANEALGIYIQALGGSSGVELLGRFCDLDSGMTQQVRAILDDLHAPSQDGPIHAEVVHLPQDRVLNVVARPMLSEYEICYLGQGSCAPEKQIWVSDLMVSLQQNRFVLRSARLQREVVPRLTSAHNYGASNVPLYHFLCALASQDQPVIGFSWPATFRWARFLPRVSLAGVVVSLASWRLDKSALDALRHAHKEGQNALRTWREERKMPRFVTLDAGDNVLPVDWDNALMVQMFLDETGHAAKVEVKEALALNHGAAPGMCRNLEVVLPMRVESGGAADAGKSAGAAGAAGAAGVAKSAHLDKASAQLHAPETMLPPWLYLPGSEWIYFKIYGGQAQADELLTTLVAPFMRAQLADGHIEKWFFIRYNDPEPHIRVRALGRSQQAALALVGELSQLCQRAMAAGLCWRVVSDAYQREVQRYGGLAAMAECETIFHLDSELVLDLIQTDALQIPVARRWLFGVNWVLALLQEFYPDVAGRKRLAGLMAESFKREFGFGSRQKTQLGAKFRGYRAELEKWVIGSDDDPVSMQQRALWQALMAPWQARLLQHVAHIKRLQQQGQLETSQDELVQSLIHMHCNRLFSAKQRSHEVVFYDFLLRILESQQARARVVDEKIRSGNEATR